LADNVAFQATVATPASGVSVAADEATYSGDTAKIQITRHVHVSGSEGSKTVNEVYGSSTPAAGIYGLTVRKPVISTAHLIAAGSGDATSVKASAGTLKSVHVFSKAAAPIYVKFHNTAGAPTPGASVVFALGVQAGTERDLVLPDGGRAFTTGIALTLVTGIADANSTGVTAEDCVVEVCYE
jgi:hypothetical protein